VLRIILNCSLIPLFEHKIVGLFHVHADCNTYDIRQLRHRHRRHMNTLRQYELFVPQSLCVLGQQIELLWLVGTLRLLGQVHLWWWSELS
jgi:hypothetical protein